ncbi:MAG: PAS domain S-box protein [Candidatus Buchananbacteria bacterium]|nr:PAS domain S-box protein [Candidatus Buchananbacteria bacterium]
MKIKQKFSLFFSLQLIIMMIVVGLVIIFLSSQVSRSEIIAHLQTTVESRTHHIETYFEQSIERLKMLTSRTKLRELLKNYNQSQGLIDKESMKGIIQDAKMTAADLDQILIIGLDGRVITSTDEDLIGYDFSNQDFFIVGKQTEGVYLLQKPSGEFRIFVFGPLDLNNQLLGVGVMLINLDELDGIISDRTGLGETGEVIVAFYDTNGVRRYPSPRLFESRAIDQSQESVGTALPMKEALKGNHQTFEDILDYRNVRVMAASSYVKIAHLGVVAKMDRSEALAGVNRVGEYFIFISFIFIIIFYFLNYFLSSKLVKPIEILRRGIRIVEGGNLDYKVAIDSQDEIGQLSRSFDQMTQSIKKAYDEVELKVQDQTQQIKESKIELENQQKALLNILEDVEKEKINSESLAKDLEKFKLAVDNASDHIVITDQDGTILYANKGMEKITGFKIKEVLGKKVGSKATWGGLMDSDFYKKMWNTISVKKQVFIGELKNHRKNGVQYETSASISPILNQNGKVVFFVGIERDITKEKEVDRAKTEFVSLASHQLRTPLSSINWYTEMLLAGDAGKINKEQKSYLEEVYKGNKRMVDLVNSLLNVSRLDLGTFIVEPELTDIPPLAISVIDELKPMIAKKQLKVTQQYDKNLPKINVDPKLLRVVFQNLLSNAVKYTPEQGSVVVELHLIKPGQAVGKEKIKVGSLAIIVSDTGFGIPKDQQDKIFVKLFRADNVREKDTEGTGLGLYIVKSIVTQSGGKVWFDSVEDKGTKFYVVIPLSGMKKKEGTKTIG